MQAYCGCRNANHFWFVIPEDCACSPGCHPIGSVNSTNLRRAAQRRTASLFAIASAASNMKKQYFQSINQSHKRNELPDECISISLFETL